MNTQPRWRGLVNQLTYDVDLSSPPDAATINWIVEALVEQSVFSRPVAQYFDAAVEALDSTEDLGFGEKSDGATREFLRRLVDELKRAKPWPAPQLQTLAKDHWATLSKAPVIGHIKMSRMRVSEHLNYTFTDLSPADHPSSVLLLLLRSGQRIALHSTLPYTSTGVAVLSFDGPTETINDFRRLTGIDIVAR